MHEARARDGETCGGRYEGMESWKVLVMCNWRMKEAE